VIFTLPTTGDAEDLARRDAFAARLNASLLGMVDILTLYIGDRLGLYAALAEHGPLTSLELAELTETQERYVREWLEQQAVSGVLEVFDTQLPAALRRYDLSPAHAEVLLDRDSLNYLAPLARIMVSVAGPLPRLLEAFTDGGGVAWSELGADAREGQADAYRPIYLKLLGKEWLPRIPSVHARLRDNPSAQIADFGCGAGWGSIGLAQAYPLARVDGFDLDAEAIELARQNAADYGLRRRIAFHVRDAADSSLVGQYDLVTVFEALHDMAQPVEALRTMRQLLAPGGAVLVVDERVADRFTAPGDDVERLLANRQFLEERFGKATA
jgi:hypothetical protein